MGIILGAFVGDYLNRADVRKALNIPTTIPAYEECSSTMKYTLQKEGSYWIYPILKEKIRILFYSGDTDGAVPTFESKQWIKDLNLRSPSRPAPVSFDALSESRVAW